MRDPFPGAHWDGLALRDDLEAFTDAWRRTQEMQGLFLLLLQASADQPPDDSEEPDSVGD